MDDILNERPPCDLCGGAAEELAKFGQPWWFRCRYCGTAYLVANIVREVTREAPEADPKRK
jgi:tRNA(Ile2) C34 agmatinyltransferase TiaS